ncbi:superoxide dismutase family protein [Pontixanthobacter sp.]|uniref:superoxide dismutase family protein n=1 Tax=Pontixanthobacter sp. TaxID=2792078 RepID=UPI003C7BA0CB
MPASDTATSITQIGKADLFLADGTSAGTAAILTDDGAVTLTVDAKNLPSGPHGFHLHQTGRCEAPDFASAGGHLNPLDKTHGSLSEDGSHVGDLPNLDITEDGTGTLNAPLQGSTDELTTWLHDEDGTAVMIHVDADDYITDPTGNAGSRLACGILRVSDNPD